jgi:SNF2 family DNA or RNA helicase
MVFITWNEKAQKLQYSWSGPTFTECVESAKRLRLEFKPVDKYWLGDPMLLDEALDEFKSFDKVCIDEYTRQEVESFKENLRELRIVKDRKSRYKYIPELMKLQPLIDKKCDGDILKSFQLQDLIWLINRNRGVIPWDCGMGKSWITAAIIAHGRYYKLFNKCLIFSSNIGLYNLSNEIRKFIGDEVLTIGSVTEINDRNIFDVTVNSNVTIVMGYDVFRNISDWYDKTVNNRKRKVKYTKSSVPISKWLENKPGCIMFDECHYLGHYDSLRTKAISMIINNFDYRYQFSATYAPVYEQMYSPLRILDPGIVDGLSYYNWLTRYVELGNRFSKYAINQNTWNLSALDELNQTITAKYSVPKRKRDEYLDLPPLIHEDVIRCKWSPKHRLIYESFAYWLSEDIRQQSKLNHKGLVSNFLNNFPFAMMSVENPRILIDSKRFGDLTPKLQQEIRSFNFETHHEKLRYLDAIVSDHCDENEQKILIYYYHPRTMENLRDYYQKRDPYVVSADISKDERLPLVEKFKQSRSKILICSIAAASTSITVTEAKAIVFFETGFDGIAYDQACGRIHRPGQTDITKIYDLRMENSFDELQYANIMRKGEIINKLMAKQDLTPDEWRSYFSYSAD